VHDRQSGTIQDLTEKLDRSVGSFTWLDSNSILFSSEDHGASLVSLAPVGAAEDVRITQINQKDLIHADDLVWVNGTLFSSQMSAQSGFGIKSAVMRHDALETIGVA